MASETTRGTAPPGECNYLPAETASLEYRYLLDVSVEEYEAMLARGWRRQGMCFFRPACPACVKCRSLRVDVAEFRPTKSQRRCLKRNADVRHVVRRASLSPQHITLFNDYHADMNRRRAWGDDGTSPAEYSQMFLAGNFPFASEFVYLRGDQPLGVGLVDMTPESLSSVYFYHDPDWRPDGPGTLSVLKELEFARETGRRWLYLGYWISENPSMSYKNRFGPYEVLERYVSDDELPVWKPACE